MRPSSPYESPSSATNDACGRHARQLKRVQAAPQTHAPRSPQSAYAPAVAHPCFDACSDTCRREVLRKRGRNMSTKGSFFRIGSQNMTHDAAAMPRPTGRQGKGDHDGNRPNATQNGIGYAARHAGRNAAHHAGRHAYEHARRNAARFARCELCAICTHLSE